MLVMAKHLESGKYGEQQALAYLKEKGYLIKAINWRYRYWEVDIIAQDKEALCFIEVKTRRSNLYGEPSTFVDYKKQKNLIQAAEAYIELTHYEGEIRFDIVSVYSESKQIDLIKDAFWSN